MRLATGLVAIGSTALNITSTFSAGMMEVARKGIFHPQFFTMPELLTNGSKSPKDEMLAILDSTAAKTWKQDAARLRELVAAL